MVEKTLADKRDRTRGGEKWQEQNGGKCKGIENERETARTRGKVRMNEYQMETRVAETKRS